MAGAHTQALPEAGLIVNVFPSANAPWVRGCYYYYYIYIYVYVYIAMCHLSGAEKDQQGERVFCRRCTCTCIYIFHPAHKSPGGPARAWPTRAHAPGRLRRLGLQVQRRGIFPVLEDLVEVFFQVLFQFLKPAPSSHGERVFCRGPQGPGPQGPAHLEIYVD